MCKLLRLNESFSCCATMLRGVIYDAASPCRGFHFFVGSSGATALNNHLRFALEEEERYEVPCLTLYGTVPDDTDGDLLRRLFGLMRGVETQYTGQTAMKALSNALVQENCMIDKLCMAEVDQYVAPGVFAANTSLQTVRLLRPATGRAEISCLEDMASSRVIEWIYAMEWEMAPVHVLQMLGSMPSLQVLAGSLESSPPTIMHEWWTGAVAKLVKTRYIVLRHAGVMLHSERRKLRALYECAGKILPDCVIRDIADLMPHSVV